MAPNPDDGVTVLSDFGQMFEDRDDKNSALLFYRSALQFLEMHAESEDASPLVHRDLVEANREIAGLEEETGDRKSAAASYRACLGAAGDLVRMARDSRPLRHLYASHLVDYALFERRSKNWREALDAYEKAGSTLPESTDGSSRQMALRALIDEGIGDVHSETGATGEAIAAWTRARGFVQSALEAMEDRPERTEERAVAEERLADLEDKLAGDA